MNYERTNRVIVAIVAVWVSFGLLACAPTARYRVLNFFFDGVPKPGSEGVVGGAQAVQVEISPFRQALIEAARNAPPIKIPEAPKIVSVHKPVAEKRCTECHDTSRGLEAMARDATLCDKCHKEQRLKEGWSHGPLNLGTCVPCHQPHESPYPHLLERPVPELCFYCHSEEGFTEKEYHDVPNWTECSACHDPHRMY